LETLEQMHWLDTTILVVLGIGSILGIRNGFVRQTVRLGIYLLSGYLAVRWADPSADLLKDSLLEASSPCLCPLSCGLTFLASYLGLFGASRLFQGMIKAFGIQAVERPLRWTMKTFGLRALDRLLGGAVGLVLTSLLLGTLFLGLAFVPEPELEAKLSGSTLLPVLTRTPEAILAAISQERKEELMNALKRLRQGSLDLARDLGEDRAQRLERQANELSGDLQNIRQSLEKPVKRTNEASPGEALRSQPVRSPLESGMYLRPRPHCP
jgi:uncharacterized membrane protein required for colicin V production